ncbi:hypothetical protein [Pseudoruegeria sp. SHC-113]|uniref:hypothetical protein n=1 Tax=Pseudoruegeria sp. SHC-113 TaxID=2855439 RepID=UPI0021BA559E|nr:hypothetical protein [Pseudoruegeria sp. SHC-113]MCT8161174.1 hypothetical protein [Pseudoruegeria sp. SHC-113]
MPVTGYFFVMDGLRFESQAILLATSLRRQMGPKTPIIAYVSEPKLAEITRVTRHVLRNRNVEIRALSVEGAGWATPYPHGNKILAACARREGWDVSVFLDTDTVCLAPMDFSDCAEAPCLAAVPEGVPTWGRNIEDWEAAYASLGLAVPEARVRLTRGRNRRMPPYFNAGLVAFKEEATEGGARFPEVWLETARHLDHDTAIAEKRPWLDQISLPIAMARMGARMIVKPESYNYSLYRRDADQSAAQIHLAHYHMPAVFRQWQPCREIIQHAYTACPPKLRRNLGYRLGSFLKPDQENAATAAE